MPVVVSVAPRIHSSFGGPSFSSLAAASAAHASHFNSLPNVPYSRAAHLSILQSRTSSSPLSFTTSSGSGGSYGNASLFNHRVARARSPSFHAPMSSRRAPPPPPPKVRTSFASAEEDPFADMYSATDCVVVSLPPPRRAPRTQVPAGTQPRIPPPSVTSMLAIDSAPITVSLPMAPPPPPVVRSNDQRAAKLVANVLLNRACGRPMRRRPMGCGERTYVKSSLSRMVEVDA